MSPLLYFPLHQTMAEAKPSWALCMAGAHSVSTCSPSSLPPSGLFGFAQAANDFYSPKLNLLLEAITRAAVIKGKGESCWWKRPSAVCKTRGWCRLG